MYLGKASNINNLSAGDSPRIEALFNFKDIMPQQIVIKKSRAGYRVRYIGNNNEPLAVSEVLATKANAVKNAKAMGKLFGVTFVNVTDEANPSYPVIKNYVV